MSVFNKIQKKEEEAKDKWRGEMTEKFVKFQQENKCAFIPTVRPTQQMDIVQLGFVVLTEEEARAMRGIK